MIRKNARRIYIFAAAMMMAGMMTACSGAGEPIGAEKVQTETQAESLDNTETEGESVKKNMVSATDEKESDEKEAEENNSDENKSEEKNSEENKSEEKNSDEKDSEEIKLDSGKDVTIDKDGVYVISGNAQDVTVTVDASDEDEVQLVLDGVSVTNSSKPVIYVKSADKVLISTTDSENKLEVTGDFEADGDTNLDAVIFSKDDLELNGFGTLSIASSDNAVSSKDTLEITGGSITVSCSGNAFEAHDAIEISDGEATVTECNDGLHAEDSDDDSIGSVYISGGSFNINAEDDAIHATTTIDIYGGEFSLNGGECIEGTYITINDGKIDITAADDGINAAAKSKSYTPTFILNGGEVTISMGAGDTDGVDSNGNIIINGGKISISGQSTFDFDGTAEYNGGTIIENGTETNAISNQAFGPGGMGGPGGAMRDHGNMNPEDFGNMNPEGIIRNSTGGKFRQNDLPTDE